MIIINDSLTRADAATQYKLLSTLIAQKHQMTVVQPQLSNNEISTVQTRQTA